MPDVFVSYSRRDGEFVHALAADLEARGKSVWIDTQGIGDGEVFPEAIRHAIEQSDAFVFVITPESVASRYCETEVEYAQQLQKRVVPVLRELVEDDGLPEAIRVRNWIPYTPDVDAAAASERLVAALDTDLEHTHAHTRWLVKALDWDSHERDPSFLLRGSELAEARRGWQGWVTTQSRRRPRFSASTCTPVAARRRAGSGRCVGAAWSSRWSRWGWLTSRLMSRSQAVSARTSGRSLNQTRSRGRWRRRARRSFRSIRNVNLAGDGGGARPADTARRPTRFDGRSISRQSGLRLPNVGVQPTGVGWGPGVAYSPDGKQIAEGSQNGTCAAA